MLTVKNFNHTYLITFKDYDGTVLSSERIVEGNMPTVPSVTPRQGYQFTGWSPSVGVVTQDQIYTATYEVVYDFNSHPMGSSEASMVNQGYADKKMGGTSDFNSDYGWIYNGELERLAYGGRIKYSLLYFYAFAYYSGEQGATLMFAKVQAQGCPYTQEEIEDSFATTNPPQMDKNIWEYVKALNFK